MKFKFSSVLLISLALLLFQSCEKLEITNNERLLVKGKIVDQNGNALANIPIKTEAVNRILAKTTTDTNGNFAFTSLNANTDPLHVLVNIAANFELENENPDYASKVFSSEGGNEQLLLDLGTITLSNLGSFSMLLKNLHGDNNTVEYTLSYTSKVCRLPLEFNNNDACEFDQSTEGFLDATSQNRTLGEESVIGTVAIFEYRLNNEPTQTIEIPVTNPPVNYVFEY
ncbi:carboxypeptidase-like regulatory domain-containing protein [Aequorivita sp. SDUM287046]|uniref:Carboxypeptidase-like regulatory domain-containing protein n=1 Tax=Aequorivita aurantiaca TaxID=3053356 RepID=A0ABT8DL11_9FLAO|nr:carboxypeptidase-like regulatory domain-containing protein [Aequorivita aurantiaca]MDN3723830.1 carboxypeptidase-like regulatory domain-containing protein [Aequorivita aurantiaca]